jgi:hypothetical protein
VHTALAQKLTMLEIDFKIGSNLTRGWLSHRAPRSSGAAHRIGWCFVLNDEDLHPLQVLELYR